MSRQTAPISVIICAYTEKRWTDICEAVDSLRSQTMAPLEIILVIDHNSALRERAKAHFPDITLTENKEAQGLSGARNSGVAIAKGEFVAFLDDDATADEGWIEHLLIQSEQPHVLGVTGEIKPNWLGQKPRWFPDEFLWVVGCSYRGQPTQVSEVRNVLGASCCFRRDVFRDGAGFSDRMGRKKSKFPLSCEETEFCIRAKQAHASGRFMFDPGAVVHHKVPRERLTWSYFMLRTYAEGISKAYLSGSVGAGAGLASERAYALGTLPRAFFQGFADAFLRMDIAGLARSAAVVLGLSCATLGFAVGEISSPFGATRSTSTECCESQEEPPAAPRLNRS